MKPLLWKEFREVWFQFVLWALAFLFCAATRKIPSFEPAYTTTARLLIPLGAALVVIATGVSNVIQERRTRTLDFLLTRPTSASQIIWAKFLVGSAVVLYIVSLFAAFIYLQNEDASSGSYLSQAAQVVGWPKVLAVFLPPFWFIYAFTLLVSVLVDEAAKAFAIGVAFVFWLFLAVLALSSIPPFFPATLWFPSSLSMCYWTLDAGNGALPATVAATWCGLAILAGILAGRFLERRREPKSNWLVLAAWVALPFVIVIVGPRWALENAVTVSPAGAYTLSGPLDSSIIADGDRVAVPTQGGLDLIDFSDPAHPRRLAKVSVPVRAVWGVRLTDDSAYVVGPSKDFRGDIFIVLRVDLTGAAAPEVEQILTLGAIETRLKLGGPYLVSHYLYFGDINHLRVFDLSAKEGARETAALEIDGSMMAVKGNYAYVLCRSELVTLDVTDPARPRVTRRTPLGFVPASMPRGVTVVGDALYTQGIAPPGLLRFDLKNPDNPVVASQTPTGSIFLGREGLASDEGSSTLVVAYRDGVLAFRAPTGLLLHDVRYIKPSEKSAQRIAIGKRYFYALIEGNRVAAFPLPRIN